MDIKAYKNLNDSNINEMHDYYASKVNNSVDTNNDNLIYMDARTYNHLFYSR